MKKINTKLLYTNYIGWLGVLLLVGSHVLMSFGLLSSKQVVYYAANFVGALCIVVFASARQSKQTVLLNVFSSSMALLNLVKLVTMMH